MSVSVCVCVCACVYIYVYISIYRERERERERESVKHKLKGIELVRVIISQLVSAVVFLKGIFWNSWLSPNGTSIFNFWIQKFSLITNISCSASIEPFKITILSIMMDLAHLLKLCPFSWKCLQARMELCLLVSYLWLFNLRLNAVSATYCIFIVCIPLDK